VTDKGKRAVFLDRDGTINVDKGYLWQKDEFEFLPGVPQALKRLKKAGFLLIVVTNQSGVARNYFQLEDVETLHRHMTQYLSHFGVTLDGIYVCPHHPSGQPGNPYAIECSCRKGQPGMLLQAARDLNIDLKNSFMIGDKSSDMEAGSRAGCTSLRLIPAPSSDSSEFCCACFDSLPKAVDHIIVSL